MWVRRLSNIRMIGVAIVSFAFFLVIWLNLPWLTLKAGEYYRPLLSSFGWHAAAGIPANATLGVQHIFAISSENPSDPASWRQKGLIAAANRTGLWLEIVSTHDLQDWEVEGIHAQSKGSAQAWAAHNRILRQIVNDNVTMAIVMEDDVDWDLDIRKLLAPYRKIAGGARNLTGANSILDISLWPYGDKVDVFWLGHCGGRLVDSQPNITSFDESVLPAGDLTVWDRGPYVGAPDGFRSVRAGDGVVCSFAYAITSSAAAKLLARRGNHEVAFDIEMSNVCGGELQCLTVQPELFHQQRMVGGRGSLINEANQANEEENDESSAGRPLTFNIRYSARCNAGHNETDRVQCLPRFEDRMSFNGR